MAPRVELQTLLESITENVYFQPPSESRMQYPCIMYERESSRTQYADNKPYAHTKGYQVTVVDRKPDSELPDLVEELPQCAFNRTFRADGLYHFVFTLFF